MNEYIDMWKHFADFSGTTSVKGYWMAALINFIIALVINLLATQVGFFVILSNLYTLAILIPGLAICIRRLRDAGKHWTNIFWPFLPLVGAIVLIVKLCGPSQNQSVYMN